MFTNIHISNIMKTYSNATSATGDLVSSICNAHPTILSISLQNQNCFPCQLSKSDVTFSSCVLTSFVMVGLLWIITIVVIAWCIEVLLFTFNSLLVWSRVTSHLSMLDCPCKHLADLLSHQPMAYNVKVGFNRIIYPKQGTTSINNISKQLDLFKD